MLNRTLHILMCRYVRMCIYTLTWSRTSRTYTCVRIHTVFRFVACPGSQHTVLRFELISLVGETADAEAAVTCALRWDTADHERFEGPS